MFRAAALVIALGCALRAASSLSPAFAQPEVLVAGCIFAWLLWGPVWGVAVATTAWSILSISWALDDRLDPALAGRDIMVTGTICDFPRDDGRARRFLLQIVPDPTDPVLPARIYLSSYGVVAGRLAGGQTWRLKVRLKRPRGLANPGAFDFERWALERRIGATGYVRKSAANRRIEAADAGCQSMRLRQFLADGIERAVDPPGAARFLLALAVGARHRLTRDDWTLLRRTGTVHLVAISGLHIGLVAGLMLWVGRALASALLFAGLRCQPLFSGRVFALAGAAGYAALAGFSVPTMRALVMVTVVVGLATMRRVVGGWQILGAAAIAVMWADPLALIGSGFWLSFGAVGVLLLAGLSIPPAGLPTGGIARRFSEWSRLLVHAQLALSLGLAPLSLMFFSQVSLVAPLTNLLVVPAFAFVIVPLTLLGTLSLLFVPVAAATLLSCAATFLDAGLVLLTQLSGWSGSVWRQAAPGNGWLAAMLCGAVVLTWPRPLRGRLFGALPLVAVACGLGMSDAPALRVVVMDAGQGLAVLVQTPDHALLYDAGPAFGDRDAGQTVVLPVLRHFGVTKLDAVVISHGDNDHVGGAATVLDAYPDATLVATESFGLSANAVETCRAGLHWRWNAASFRILHPDDENRSEFASDNDRSCVLSVSTVNASLLLPGDIERRAEQRLVDSGLLTRHELVVAPHHGSATSSSAPFVAALGPRVVVFSTGFANRWGFPDPAVGRRWRSGGARSVDTGDSGALVFEAGAHTGLELTSRHRAAMRRIWTEGDPPDTAGDSGASTNYHGARL